MEMLHLCNRVLRRYSLSETWDLPQFIFVGIILLVDDASDESKGKEIFSEMIKQICPDYLDKIRGNRKYSLGKIKICSSASV